MLFIGRLELNDAVLKGEDFPLFLHDGGGEGLLHLPDGIPEGLGLMGELEHLGHLLLDLHQLQAH